jgi:DNA-binding transcriptional LysR family regulator
MARLEGASKDLLMLLEIDSRLMPLAADRIAIRCSTGPWPGNRSILLTTEVSRPYATDALATPVPHVLALKDILVHPLIRDQYDDSWPVWLDDTHLPRRSQDRHLPGSDLTLLAAAQGMGIVLVREPYGAETCKNLGFVPVSDLTVANSKRLNTVTHKGRQSAAALRLADRIATLFSAPSS